MVHYVGYTTLRAAHPVRKDGVADCLINASTENQKRAEPSFLVGMQSREQLILLVLEFYTGTQNVQTHGCSSMVALACLHHTPHSTLYLCIVCADLFRFAYAPQVD